jgi:hypothetical protein
MPRSMTVLPAPDPARAAATELLRQHAARETFAALAGDLAPADAEAAIASRTRAWRSCAAAQDNARRLQDRDHHARNARPGGLPGLGGRAAAARPDASLERPHQAQRLSSDLIVEFEIAFEIARDLPANADAMDRQRASCEHVKCAYPALEIADDRNADYPSLKHSVADADRGQRLEPGLVLGEPVRAWMARRSRRWRASRSSTIGKWAAGTGRDVLGHPLDALAWLANHLAARGCRCMAGDIVTTGSLVKSQFPVVGNRIAFRLPGFGEVHLSVEYGRCGNKKAHLEVGFFAEF